ncbi:MAG: SusC/RagA family TonB-linked outer membrane protein [Bacteroidota bacterium]
MRSKFKWIFTLLLALTMQFSFAQEKTITGVVSDAAGPLPGANVVIKGTQRGISTGFDGGYSIKAKVGEQLVFSFMGLTDVVRTVGDASVMNVTMQDDAKKLDEVVVQAFGIKKRKDAVTSSQQQVSNKELTQASNPSVITSLAGKVSGVQINTTSNGANPNTRIVMRGMRSISGDNRALVVIDGVISSAEILAQLPPDIVESANIIKGSQGAALYGEQGVNGVVIVTTKKGGKSGKIKVNVNTSVDFEDLAFLPERQTKYGQGWATDLAFTGGGLPGGNGFNPWENGAWGPAFDDPNMPAMVPVGLPQADGSFLYTKWAPIKDNIAEFFELGTTTQAGANLMYGNGKSDFLLSYNRQETNFVIKNDNLVRNTITLKANTKAGKWNLGGNINYILQGTSETSGDLYNDLMQTASNIPVNRFSKGINQHHWTVYYHSPYFLRDAVRDDSNSNIVNVTADLGYEINKNINVNFRGNYAENFRKEYQHNDGFGSSELAYEYILPDDFAYGGDTSPTYADLGGSAITSFYQESINKNSKMYADFMVNLDYSLTENIGLKSNIGFNVQDQKITGSGRGGTGLITPGWYNMANVTNLYNNNGIGFYLRNTNDDFRNRKVGAFVNVDLDYKDYLFLNLTGRLDKSSVLYNSLNTPGLKTDGYFYPSVGVSFIPTKAIASFENSKKLNYLKVAASYVVVANTSAISPYDINNIIVPSGGFPSGYELVNDPTDPNIKPEYVNTIEATVNSSWFNDRLTLDVSAYQQDTNDLISRRFVSRTSGEGFLKSNVGDLRNKGLEFDLGVTPVKTSGGFVWNLKGSYSLYNTKITKLAEGLESAPLLRNGFVGVFAEVGEDFPLIKGTKFVRDDNGNIIVDEFGNPEQTSTYEKLGKASPDYIVGLTNSFEYKGIKLTAVADFRTGHKIYSETIGSLGFAGHLVESAGFDRNLGYIIPGSVDSNGNANTLGVGGGGYAGVLDYFSTTYTGTGETNVVDATALKIREISLSYSLPTKLIEKIGMESFKIGVNARNPFVFLGNPFKGKSSYSNKGYTDPEASISDEPNSRNYYGNAMGLSDIGKYPTTKTYGFTINVTF